jgi:hypothetical protein
VTLDEAIRASGADLARRLPKGTVLVVSNFSASTRNLSDYVIEELSGFLVKDGGLKVAARQELELLQREMDFQFSGEVSDETQQAIGKKLGAQTVISGSLIPMGASYLMRVKAINVESALTQVSESYIIRRNELLIGLLDPSADTSAPQTWNNFMLDIGLRAGVSPRFYTLSDDIAGSATQHISIEGAVQLTARLVSFNFMGLRAGIAIQTETLFTYDTVNYTGEDEDGEYSGEFTYFSLGVPLLASLVVEFGESFSLAFFTGAHFTIPLGQMSYTVLPVSAFFDYTVPLGLTGGVQSEMRQGAGMLIADIRYIGDLGHTSLNGAPGTLAAFSRSMLSFSVGYKFRLRF